MVYVVKATLAMEVYTQVEAESKEEAAAVARTRDLGKDPNLDWVLDETQYKDSMKASN